MPQTTNFERRKWALNERRARLEALPAARIRQAAGCDCAENVNPPGSRLRTAPAVRIRQAPRRPAPPSWQCQAASPAVPCRQTLCR